MSALAKNTSSKSSSKKSTSSKSTSKDNGASPKNAKGKTTTKAKAKFAGSLATAVKPTPPHQPTKPKQAPKPKKKDQGVPESPVMGQAAASPEGASAAASGPGATGAKQGAGKGAKSETSKAAKKVNTQKPSKIIKAYKGLGKNVTASKKKDEAKAHDAIPDYHAVMPGDAAMEAEGKKQNPKADTKVDDKVPGAEGKAPKIEKQKKGKSKRQKVDSKSAAELKRLAAIENALDAMKSMLASMTAGISTDSNVNTDPGPAPEIVFSGSSNPQRAEKADAEADTKINDGHEKFVKAIDDGKQPSDVKRQEMDEVIKAVKQSDLKIGEEQLAAGEKYYEKLIKEHTTKEIDNADGILDPDIQGQMAKANKDMDKSLEKQETDRQAALDKAKADIDSQNQKAKDEQESIVDKAKKDIAKQQKDTRKKQDEEVKKAKKKGDKEKKKVEKDIADKEQKDEKKIEGEYTKAEKKAEAEEKKAEKKAQRKKREAEKKKKEQSWWERAKSAVSSFVDSVCSVIGDIFDALSSLVSGILNAVKDLACAIIDEAIKWAKKALDDLGSLLKGLVNGLIGDIFPGLAKALNEGIDAGIDLAKKGVDTVGEKLKEGVTATIDAVNATVQKGLQVAKVGLQTAVRVTGCIATGDFEGAFLATFYGALEIAGVSRSDADKMLGDAKETIKLVVDDFGGFAGNLISAAGDGFANFGKNFLSHFTGAVTDWLLGPVAAAGLKAPEKWDAQGIFGMVLGVLGVSTDSLKEMATERIGEDNMAALEKAFEYVTAFIDGGFAGLWEQAKSDLGNIWDLVLGMITDYISQKVVQFGMEQLASLMAGPFGALYQALKTAWGIYQTVRDKISEIKEVLTAIFSSVSDIARGNTKKASDWVENALAKVLGIAIDLGANLAGIGDIPDKIRGFVEGLQERVKTAIGKAMDWVLEKVKGLFSKGGDDDKKEPEATEDESEKDNGRRASQLPGAVLASAMGAITINYAEPSAAGHPPILQSKGAMNGALRSKGLPGLEKEIKKADTSAAQKKALENMKLAKGVSMGLESKGQRYLAGENNLSEAEKSMDLLGANVLEAASFVGGLNKRDDGIDILPKPFKFTAKDGHKHTLYARRSGEQAQLSVASIEKPVAERIKGWQKDLQKLSKEDKKTAGGLLGKAIAMEKAADALADKAVKPGADKSLAEQVEAKMKEIAVVLGQVFALMDKPPQQWIPAVHDPYAHPNFAEFKLRATTKLNPPMSESEVKALWGAVMKSAGIACEAQAKTKAGTKETQDAAARLRAKSKAEYKKIAKKMLKGRFDKLAGRPYALWSGGAITMEFAFAAGYTALEKTQAGTLFDNLSILSDNWDAEQLLWHELSREFANMPVIGTVHCFQRWQGDVFSKVEKPELEKRARKANALDKLKFRYHSIVGKDSFSDYKLNEKYNLAGPKKTADLIDLGESDSETAWSAKLKAHDAKLEKTLGGGGGGTKTTKEIVEQPDVAKGINAMQESGRAHIQNAIKANLDKFQSATTWDQVKGLAVAHSKTVKKMVDEPGSIATDFGKYVIQKQAPKAVIKANEAIKERTPAGQPPVDILKTKSADAWAKAAASPLNKTQVPFVRARESVDKQLWDKNHGSAASRFLREGFEEMLESAGQSDTHDLFKPINYRIKHNPDGSSVVTYDTKAGQSFIVNIDGRGMVKTVEGANLRLKPSKLKGLRGYTARSGRKTTKARQDAAHIIADEFGGSGYKEANNLITTSAHFNRVIMRDVEKLLAKDISLAGGFSFNAKVRTLWTDYSNDKVIKKVYEANKDKFSSAADAQKQLKDFHSKNKLSKNLMRCKNVIYEIDPFAEDGSALPKKVYQTKMDKWLGT